MSKLYIAVLDEVPAHMVPTLVAHAVLGAHLAFSREFIINEEGPFKPYVSWLENSFKKVVLKVNRKEFSRIAEMPYIYLAHENKTLNAEKSCIVVSPRDEYPNVIKFAKMWQP